MNQDDDDGKNDDDDAKQVLMNDIDMDIYLKSVNNVI